jgi:hypothetical protein
VISNVEANYGKLFLVKVLLLDPIDLAEVLGLQPSTIYAWRHHARRGNDTLGSGPVPVVFEFGDDRVTFATTAGLLCAHVERINGARAAMLPEALIHEPLTVRPTVLARLEREGRPLLARGRKGSGGGVPRGDAPGRKLVSAGTILLPIDDVATVLGMKNKLSVFRWIREGKLPSAPVHAGVDLWPLETVREAVEERNLAAAAETALLTGRGRRPSPVAIDERAVASLAAARTVPSETVNWRQWCTRHPLWVRELEPGMR